MILTNHQIITGLQVQNYHYIYVFGPLFFAVGDQRIRSGHPPL